MILKQSTILLIYYLNNNNNNNKTADKYQSAVFDFLKTVAAYRNLFLYFSL